MALVPPPKLPGPSLSACRRALVARWSGRGPRQVRVFGRGEAGLGPRGTPSRSLPRWPGPWAQPRRSRAALPPARACPLLRAPGSGSNTRPRLPACSPPPPPLARPAPAASQPHPRRPEQSGGRLEPEVSAARAGGGGGLDPGSAGGGDAPGTRLFVSPSLFAGSGASTPPGRCLHPAGRPGERAGGWQRDPAVSVRSSI